MTAVPYAELHAHSYYSFADGADSPADLAAEAARLGLAALAVTDHDGLYAVPELAAAAADCGLATVFGAELNLGMASPRRGQADPAGEHLVVLARNPEGYRRLSAAITEAKLAGGEKDLPAYDLDALAAEAQSGHWQVLTGGRKGPLGRALEAGGWDGAEARLAELAERFGPGNLAVEAPFPVQPGDSERLDVLAALAARHGLPLVATAGAHYARPERAPVAAALAAVRARRSLESMDAYLPAYGSAHLRGGPEVLTRYLDFPDAVANAARIGAECAFDLQLLAPRLPHFPVPDRHDDFSYLAQLTLEGARARYGPPGAERVPGAYRQLDRELTVIRDLGFCGYFLIVTDIVRFCRDRDIYCQGRGSAANSAVCFALGITNVDPVSFGLLFERFLAPERDGPPDIDVDIESGRREEVIQYVYERYGRRRAALVANTITYRPRSAVRDAAKALGHPPEQAVAWSKRLSHYRKVDPSEAAAIPADVQRLAEGLAGLPQHLGIHPGGMVLTEQPVSEIVPVEPARMAGRTVLQWDKEGAAFAGLVKFDLLGLGMLEALHRMVDAIAEHHGEAVDLAMLPPDDTDVYDLLCDADTVGVFQVESRAQMSTLPRLRPRCFADIVMEVALIRPGPIQGGAVHPILRRRRGEAWEHLVHPRIRSVLAKTYGVPLYQEQLMQMAMRLADFSGGEADQLRRAMGSKRSTERMEALRTRFYDGMAANGIQGEEADRYWEQIKAFADFGFPESHSASFAHLVYASAWMKVHYPAAFYLGLLNSQPMGFYSPASLVADAQRHRITVHAPCVNASEADTILTGTDRHAVAPVRGAADLRLGLDMVHGLPAATADRIAHARTEGGPFTDLPDLTRRASLGRSDLERLATAGALASITGDRRSALWSAGLPLERPGMIAGTGPAAPPPALPGMSAADLARADYAGYGLSVDAHPISLVRAALDADDVTLISGLRTAEAGARVRIAGIITHRQRPPTARGVTFLSLEDETGIANVICSAGLWQRWREVATFAKALIVRGTAEYAVDAAPGAMPNLVADKLTLLDVGAVAAGARDYR
ncbi:error-prone DNA polymerase [Glycomyces sp. NPDC047369]